MKQIRLTIFSLLILLFALNSTFLGAAAAQSSPATTDSTGFTLIRKSAKIEKVEFWKGKKKGSGLVITFGEQVANLQNNNITSANTTGNTKSAEKQREKGPEFDRIDIVEGKYGDIKVEKKSTTENVYTLTDLTFPLRLLMYSGTDFVEFRLTETAKWNLDVNYKK
jgi:hypothetical protein